MTRLAHLLLVFALLARPVAATWSIVIVDATTGEVAIGCATCLAGIDLEVFVPVVVVGRGAAAAQSFVDVSGANRLLIWNGFMQGLAPGQILNMLAMQDPQHQTRQYGIVNAFGDGIAFTGTSAGAYAAHVVGQVGNLVYAVQGNVLTGAPVIAMAEQAILNTPGDIAAKLMAAMQAARLMGGDGRCSCSPSNPTGCGSPPASFTNSANVGFMIVARPGDQNGVCNGSQGCATGTYYMDLNVAFQPSGAVDPVIQLQGLFNAWRASWTGRPDHFLSTVAFAPATLPADGTTATTMTITLRDWQGTPVAGTGAAITVTADPSGTVAPSIGAATALGNGVYAVPVTAPAAAGIAMLRIVVDDGQGPVQLGPLARLDVLGDPLWASAGALAAAAGGPLDFVIHPGPAFAQRSYVLLASASGTVPGIGIAPGLVFPLNPDPLFLACFDLVTSGALPGWLGVLDAAGRATAAISFPPGFLAPLAGQDLAFAAGTLGPVDATFGPLVVPIN